MTRLRGLSIMNFRGMLMIDSRVLGCGGVRSRGFGMVDRLFFIDCDSRSLEVLPGRREVLTESHL
jgi:hypothetical protein